MPPSQPDPPLYKTHPLYHLRLKIIVSAVIGTPLTFIAAASLGSYETPLLVLSSVILLASGFLAFADLCFWSQEESKKHNVERGICRECTGRLDRVSEVNGQQATAEDDKPIWPERWIMICDFLLTGVLLWLWICESLSVPFVYYDTPFGQYFMCYLTIPLVVSSLSHARCWWREFRAREQEIWLRGLRQSLGMSPGTCDIEVATGVGNPHDPIPQASGALAATIKAKAQALNEEVQGVLASKRWLSSTNDPEENQPLLSNGQGQVVCSQHQGYGSGTCACSLPYGRQSRQNHIDASLGHCGTTACDDTTSPDVGSSAAEFTDAQLTPADSDSTSQTPRATQSVHGPRAAHNMLEKSKGIASEGEESPYTLALGGARIRRALHDLEEDGAEDASDVEIMVVKKSKKRERQITKKQG